MTLSAHIAACQKILAQHGDLTLNICCMAEDGFTIREEDAGDVSAGDMVCSVGGRPMVVAVRKAEFAAIVAT